MRCGSGSNPDKLQGYGLSTTQVLNAVNAQNAQFAAGSIGADPAVKGQTFTATVSGDTLFASPQQFRDIILRANSDGTVGQAERRRDGLLRRTELWRGDASSTASPPAASPCSCLPGANALAMPRRSKTEMASLARDLPAGSDAGTFPMTPPPSSPPRSAKW